MSNRRRHKVGELDILHAGMDVWVVLGPIAPMDGSEVAGIFNKIAQGGPKNRVGLMPTRSGLDWQFVPDPGEEAHLPPCTVECRSVEEALLNAMKVYPKVPLAAWRCGEYLCIYYDHGLGDGRFIARVIAALTNPDALRAFDFPASSVTSQPLLRALARTVRSQPVQVVRETARMKALSSLAARVRRRTAAHVTAEVSATPSEKIPAAPQQGHELPVPMFVSASATFMEQLRQYRDDHFPGVSTTSLVMFVICQSLRSAGLQLTDHVEVLSDMRRFLPEGVVTMANFVGVVNIPISADTTPDEFASALTQEAQSVQSLVMLAGTISLSRLRAVLRGGGRRLRRAERIPWTPTSQTTVTISDFSKFPPESRVKFAHNDGSEFAAVTPPGSRSHVNMVLTASGDQRMQLTAQCYRSHVDPQLVRAGLQDALGAKGLRLLADIPTGSHPQRAGT